MAKRKLKRQLTLPQLVMLGTAGTIGAQIFVLTGEAAAISGPAMLLALLVGGLLTYVIAINYCELATSIPETGGTMAYTREAFGAGLLHYLVGSIDCLSSAFFASLSAVGFGYSLNILFPILPVVPVAIVILLVFSVMNILGVGKVGNAQILLGGTLLTIFIIYIVVGFASPNGFHFETLVPNGQFFIYPDLWTNISKILRTIALIYIAYVGFEVIADDAEEAADPDRTLPRAILISLTLVMLLNLAVVSVALGTVPWQALANSKTVLTDTVLRFMPGWGVPLMAIGGLIATLTTVNSAMLSATREAFTLSRDGVWPKVFSRLNSRRTPYAAIILIGIVSALVAATGLVDFLSYISSSGYMFVLFVASIAMIRLRKKYPDMRRPIKVPFFPLTAYMAAGTGLLIVAFSEKRALLFGAGLLVVLALAHYIVPVVGRWFKERVEEAEPDQNLILVSAANPTTLQSLGHLAAIVAEGSQDTFVCLMSVIPTGPDLPAEAAQRAARQFKPQQQSFLTQIMVEMAQKNIAVYSKVRAARTVAEGILEEIDSRTGTRLLLAGWPGTLDPKTLPQNPVKVALQKAHTNVAVLLDRGLGNVNRILVPVGGGIHSRMALRLANEISMVDVAEVTVLRVLPVPETSEDAADVAESAEEREDQLLLLSEIVTEAVNSVPSNFILKTVYNDSITQGILDEAAEVQRAAEIQRAAEVQQTAPQSAAPQPYDIVVMGASEEWSLDDRLFGTVDDEVAQRVACSVLLCRRYESVPMAWLRYQVKVMEREYEKNGNGNGKGKVNGNGNSHKA